jgi:hypothetical protein
MAHDGWIGSRRQQVLNQVVVATHGGTHQGGAAQSIPSVDITQIQAGRTA